MAPVCSSSGCSTRITQAPRQVRPGLSLPTLPSSAPPSGRLICCSTVSPWRSEEHTSELQSQSNLVCRLLLEKKKNHPPPLPLLSLLQLDHSSHESTLHLHLETVALRSPTCTHTASRASTLLPSISQFILRVT